MKVFFEAFMYLQFGFDILWQKKNCAKSDHKILMKLTTGLQSVFVRSSEFHLGDSSGLKSKTSI
jgi:hypothetical protein